jgi:plastocyanin
MSLPRILLAVPGLAAGLLLPAVGDAPKAPPPTAVGMVEEFFDRSEETVRLGERLTFVNNSRVVHVIGPGRDGQIRANPPGMPRLGSPLLETNSVQMTDPWQEPGTYYVTCSVHPKMTLTVVVAP